MPIRIAINGYGRIGRSVLKAIYEYQRNELFKVVAINDMADLGMMAHLTRHDTTHRSFQGCIKTDDEELMINGDRIRFLHVQDPVKLPWKSMNVDVVLECTGLFRTREMASKHLQAGAQKVLISAPAEGDVDATIVYGVNHHLLKQDDRIVSNASCTTNCLACTLKPLVDQVGVEHGLITSIHAHTNDQVLTDHPHQDWRRARSASFNQVPTTTGAAKAVGLVMPELSGRLDGMAVRVPTINVSLIDLVFKASRTTAVEEVNAIMQTAAKDMIGVLGFCEEPLVSSDFNHCPHSATFDASLTQVIQGEMVKVFSWYDNEWGYANRMLDTAEAMMRG